MIKSGVKTILHMMLFIYVQIKIHQMAMINTRVLWIRHITVIPPQKYYSNT
jgi:hypothetical protein